ncbi:MAG: hypothetical protein KJ579_05195, partial [Verrucomicrobia bacterium]|nr:hypothetical protein [Verrucomicrobiota bacterium]
MKRNLVAAILGLGIACAWHTASADVYYWSGLSGTSDGWSDADNWEGVSVPPQGTNHLRITGSTRLSPIVDGVSPWLLGNLVFTNTTGPVTVSGNTLRFLGAGVMMEVNGAYNMTVSNAIEITGGGREIRQRGSAGTVLTLAGPIWVSNNASIGCRGSGTVAIDGWISGTGGVSRTDDGIVKLLNPTNSFLGNIAISHGWIEV